MEKNMNRVIKFRAQDFTKEWHYGFPAIGNESAIIHPLMRNGSVMIGVSMYVLRDTIGQFTGFCDVNGKEVYEGDAVEILSKEYLSDGFCTKHCVVEFIDGGFNLVMIGRHAGKRVYVSYHPQVSLEVIGNIHDNPELIKEGKQ